MDCIGCEGPNGLHHPLVEAIVRVLSRDTRSLTCILVPSERSMCVLSNDNLSLPSTCSPVMQYPYIDFVVRREKAGITSPHSSTTVRCSHGSTMALESPHRPVLHTPRSTEYQSAEDVCKYVQGANGMLETCSKGTAYTSTG